MNRPQRRTALQALEILHNIPLGDSDASDENSTSSDGDTNSESDGDTSSESDIDNVDEAVDDVEENGLDGTTWTRLPVQQPHPGRFAAQNVFRGHPGLTGYSRSVSTPLEAWRLLIDNNNNNRLQ
jgi:hypothetical protein